MEKNVINVSKRPEKGQVLFILVPALNFFIGLEGYLSTSPRSSISRTGPASVHRVRLQGLGGLHHQVRGLATKRKTKKIVLYKPHIGSNILKFQLIWQLPSPSCPYKRNASKAKT